MTTYDAIRKNKQKSVVLMIIFLAVIVAIGWAIQTWYGAAEGYSILGIAAMISIGTALLGYYGGAKIALMTNSAHEISKEDNPYVYRMVENLCISTGLPTPKVYLIRDNAINAFATGTDPEHAHIAITTGAVEKLENEELEGVLAHELSHIQNYDIRFMTLVVVLVGTIVLLSDFFFRMQLFGGHRGSSNRNGPQQIFMLVALILLILSPIIAQLIKLAVSRKREYLADASGSLMTRYPQGLANALRKIQSDDLRMTGASKASAHLYLASPFGSSQQSRSKLFATHPPIEERIAALETMGGNR